MINEITKIAKNKIQRKTTTEIADKIDVERQIFVHKEVLRFYMPVVKNKRLTACVKHKTSKCIIPAIILP